MIDANRLTSRLLGIIDGISEWSGRFVSWLVLIMVLLVCYDVAMRYLFQSGSVALQELEWHLFAVIFLLGAAYTLKHEDHVRVDMVYNSRFVGEIGRAWINLTGVLFFLIPFCLLVITASWPFVYNSFVFAEQSSDPGGLPYRFLLKAVIPLAFLLVLLQGIALMGRSLRTLVSNKKQ